MAQTRSIHVQVISPELTLAEAISKSKDLLHPCIHPPVLGLTRQTQFQVITKEIIHAITDSQGLAIYVCGLPGTGKTMVIDKVIAEINKQFDGHVICYE